MSGGGFSQGGRALARRIGGAFRRPPQPALAVVERDTDADWEQIARDEPYFGVLTSPRFLRANLSDDAVADFFASGRADIATYADEMRRRFGDFDPRSALDFGCGVGRLTRALHDMTGDATGVDVAPGMLAEAAREVRDGLRFVSEIPDRTVDWVVSIIVFQHIPPSRGYALLERLCDAVAPGGGVTLLVTFYRDDEHAVAAGGRLTPGSADNPPPPPLPRGEMIMFDYDMSRVLMILFERGFGDVQLVHTDHAGFHGAILYGLRGSAGG